MQRAFNQFNNNIKSVKELEILHYHLISEMQLPNDLSDILRSQLVYAVSALDKLIHELVRIGMLQSFLGQRLKTNKFNTFSISLETYNKIQQLSQSTEILQLERPEHFFEQEIIAKHKHLAFQDPDKIADALSFIWEEKQKWQKIAHSLTMSDDYIKKRLKNIVSRRNQIVHESDIDVQTNLRNSIDACDVKESVDFISLLGQKIFNAVNLNP
ncbi:MAG: HEPN domain-containing protein [Methylococcales bacterium]|nr:HEPN domain-containing protein [Methylococcales bacterium]MDP3840223.1 HEPN domain-containing protein [Methylococcales bacterium]